MAMSKKNRTDWTVVHNQSRWPNNIDFGLYLLMRMALRTNVELVFLKQYKSLTWIVATKINCIIFYVLLKIMSGLLLLEMCNPVQPVAWMVGWLVSKPAFGCSKSMTAKTSLLLNLSANHTNTGWDFSLANKMN